MVLKALEYLSMHCLVLLAHYRMVDGSWVTVFGEVAAWGSLAEHPWPGQQQASSFGGLLALASEVWRLAADGALFGQSQTLPGPAHHRQPGSLHEPAAKVSSGWCYIVFRQ